MTIFVELSLIFGITLLTTCLARIFRQPLVIGYILSGVIIGPYALNILHSSDYIELFSTIGISILLFIVGLNLNPQTIKDTGTASVLTGIIQVIVTSALGFFGLMYLKFGYIESFYGACALTFSSTIIILKLLSDRGDLNKLYAKISIGFLLVQDIVAAFCLLGISLITVNSTNNIGFAFIAFGIKAMCLGLLIYLISRFILSRVSYFIASSQELLFLFSIAWGLGLSALFYVSGFSIEVGALIAGVALSVSPFAYEMGSRIKPLRDFFVIMFFVLLGSKIVFSSITEILLPVILLSFFVLILKPLIVYVTLNIQGFRRKTAFYTALTSGQVSEFSLILLSLGYTLGHVSQSLLSIISFVAVITIAVSSYFMIGVDHVFLKLSSLIKIFELRKKHKYEKQISDNVFDIIIFGYDRVGGEFVHAAQKLGAKFVVVDFNPKSIQRLQRESIPFKFGDADDTEFLQELNLKEARLIVSTIPDFKTNSIITNVIRANNPSAIVILISHDMKETKELYARGATYVVMPHHLGAHHASHMIERYGYDVAQFERERNIHLNKISHR